MDFRHVEERSTSNTSAHQPTRSYTSQGRKLIKQSSSLEIIEGDVCGSSQNSTNNSRPPTQSSFRSSSRSSIGSVPPRPESSLSRRGMTPTKQISLQAVRRKEESAGPFEDDLDWRSLSRDGDQSRREERDQDLVNHFTKLRLPHKDLSEGASVNGIEDETLTTKEMSWVEKEEKDKDEKEKEDESSANEDDDGDDEEETSADKLTAPNELLLEFVDCVMKKDFKNADKLCKMILLYEPENAEALKFQPVIEEKLKLDAEAENEEDSSGEDDDDDEDDDDEDDDNDDDDSDSSSDDDSSDDDSEEDGDRSSKGRDDSADRILREYFMTQHLKSEESSGSQS